MGRYISSVAGTASDMTSNFASSNSTKNGDGFLTAYQANDITYSNVTYSSFNGGAAWRHVCRSSWMDRNE